MTDQRWSVWCQPGRENTCAGRTPGLTPSWYSHASGEARTWAIREDAEAFAEKARGNPFWVYEVRPYSPDIDASACSHDWDWIIGSAWYRCKQCHEQTPAVPEAALREEVRAARGMGITEEIRAKVGMREDESAVGLLARLAAERDIAVRRLAVATRDYAACAEAIGIEYVQDQGPSEPGPVEVVVREIRKARQDAEQTQERLRGIVDEQCGLQPADTTPDALLSLLEQRDFNLRVSINAAQRDADALRARVADLDGALQRIARHGKEGVAEDGCLWCWEETTVAPQGTGYRPWEDIYKHLPECPVGAALRPPATSERCRDGLGPDWWIVPMYNGDSPAYLTESEARAQLMPEDAAVIHHVVDVRRLQAAETELAATRAELEQYKTALRTANEVSRQWERDCEAAEARWNVVMTEATKWLSRETKPLAYRDGELFVPIDAYNSLAQSMYLAVGAVEALRQEVTAMHTTTEAEVARAMRERNEARDTAIELAKQLKACMEELPAIDDPPEPDAIICGDADDVDGVTYTCTLARDHQGEHRRSFVR